MLAAAGRVLVLQGGWSCTRLPAALFLATAVPKSCSCAFLERCHTVAAAQQASNLIVVVRLVCRARRCMFPPPSILSAAARPPWIVSPERGVTKPVDTPKLQLFGGIAMFIMHAMRAA